VALVMAAVAAVVVISFVAILLLVRGF